MLDPKFEAPRKNDSPKENTHTQLNKSGNRALVKGPKPLQRLKFYLDVKNHAVTSKLEEKIKKLGGVVEFFLDRDCTHVCSDRQICPDNQTTTSSPCTPRLQSVESNYSNESPASCDTPVSGRLRQKTRADAMLEKVRSQSTNKVRDPLQNAKLWNIPIWTVNKLLSWLEKVETVTTGPQKKKSVKVIHINPPFIKFEPLKRNARPVYKSLKSWPLIDLESNSGKPAFAVTSLDVQPLLSKKSEDKLEEKVDSQGTNDSRMTRKQRTRLSVRGAGKDQEVDRLVGGFCEICHCEYREISEHVRSEQHLNFIKNDANFLELDTLISAGANVEAFLRLNGANSYPLFCRRSLRRLNGKTEKCTNSGSGNTADDYCPPVTRNRMPRTRSSNNHSSMSADGETGGHRLRSRGQLWNAPNYQDEDSMGPRSVKDREKSAPRYANDDDDDDQEPPPKPNPVGRPRKTCPKTKRISADERLVADNKTYYKVEVMTTKLRSSGLGTRESEIVRRTQTPIPEEPEEEDEEQGLVVKFKKVRRSELSVLNDEAENFMFPRKEEFSDCDTDDGPNTTKSPLKDVLSSDLLSSERECSKTPIKSETDAMDDSSVTSYEAEILPTRRKRKRIDTLKSKNCTDDERENSNNSIDNFVSEIGLRRKSRRIYTEVDEHVDESSKDGSTVCDSEVSGGRRKRRRTHADIFISDNQRYYKFETPGSRLRIKIKPRYQGMFFPNLLPKQELPTKNNGECSETLDSIEEEQPPRLPKDDLKYSFELLPKSEPWYQTFTRHDTGNVFYTSTSDPGLYTNFIMPYQLPYIIPVNPKHCVEEYLKKKRSYLKTEAKGTISAQPQDHVVNNSAEDKKDDDSTSQTASETGSKRDIDRRLIKRKKYKSRLMKLSGHPRKSPRQHASTRAILSSLIHQRKKRERKSNGESDTSRASLASIPEEETIKEPILSEEEKQKKEEEEDRIAKAIHDIISAPFEDLSELSLDIPDELKFDECIVFKHNQDYIDLVQNTENCGNNLRPFRRGRGRYIRKFRLLPNSPLNLDGARNVRRKRKKNRTGWPKKKRLMVVKKSGQKDGEKELNDREDDSTVAELDESRLTEISIEDETGELEMCEDGEEIISACERTTEHDVDHDAGGTDGSGNGSVNGSDVSEETDDQNIQGDKSSSNLVDVKSELQNNECSSELKDNTTNNNSENSDLNGFNISGNSKTEYAETERTNGAIVKDSLVDVTAVPEPSAVLHEPNNKITKVTSTPVKNNLNNAKVTPLTVEVNTEVTARTLQHPELSSPTNNSMIKMSVSTEFSSNKVATPPKKADTVYSVTILDCKKSVVDAKRAEPAEISVKSKWEAAEKVLHYQPFVRMQKIDNSLQSVNRRLRSSSSPSPERKAKVKRAKISPTSPRSPRKLRAPRGKWYRER